MIRFSRDENLIRNTLPSLQRTGLWPVLRRLRRRPFHATLRHLRKANDRRWAFLPPVRCPRIWCPRIWCPHLRRRYVCGAGPFTK